MFWPVFHVNLAPSILVPLLCDISKISVLIAFPITILVVHTSRARAVTINDSLKIPDEESIFRSFHTQKNLFRINVIGEMLNS